MVPCLLATFQPNVFNALVQEKMRGQSPHVLLTCSYIHVFTVCRIFFSWTTGKIFSQSSKERIEMQHCIIRILQQQNCPLQENKQVKDLYLSLSLSQSVQAHLTNEGSN